MFVDAHAKAKMLTAPQQEKNNVKQPNTLSLAPRGKNLPTSRRCAAPPLTGWRSDQNHWDGHFLFRNKDGGQQEGNGSSAPTRKRPK